jgi:broad specificity phosphatase PhoE
MARPVTRRRFSTLPLAVSLFALVGHLAPAAAVDDKSLVETLRAGGLVIVLRHGATRSDQADADPVDFADIDHQRNLNDQGKAAAVAFGEAFRKIGIPVGRVYTSQFNRAYETATLAGFKDIAKSADLTYTGPSKSPQVDDSRTKALRAMLGTTPQPGTNTVLITHAPNIVAALGSDWDQVKEGEASIFRPANGGYTLIARVQIDEWPRIAAAK